MDLTIDFFIDHWSQLFASDPDIGVSIVDHQGKILFVSPGVYQIFGADPAAPVVGASLRELFVHSFVEERLRWIEKVVRERTPIRVQHVYQGRQLISNLLPLAEVSDPSVLVVTRVGRSIDCTPSSADVATEWIDLGPLSVLSDRELEVFILLGHGGSVPSTAKKLNRSPRTIERHKHTIGRKLGASTIAEIVKIVSRVGLQPSHLGLKRCNALNPSFAKRS